jgi:hypothetical protein
MLSQRSGTLETAAEALHAPKLTHAVCSPNPSRLLINTRGLVARLVLGVDGLLTSNNSIERTRHVDKVERNVARPVH